MRGCAERVKQRASLWWTTGCITSRAWACACTTEACRRRSEAASARGFTANAVAGGVRGKYFISMEDEAHHWTLFVYDTRKGLWHKEDSAHAEDFARVDDELYFLENGTLKTVYGSVGTLEGAVEWMAETGIMTYGLVGKKYVSRINLRMQLLRGPRASISGCSMIPTACGGTADILRAGAAYLPAAGPARKV